jgi:hypothetical protein
MSSFTQVIVVLDSSCLGARLDNEACTQTHDRGTAPERDPGRLFWMSHIPLSDMNGISKGLV